MLRFFIRKKKKKKSKFKLPFTISLLLLLIGTFLFYRIFIFKSSLKEWTLKEEHLDSVQFISVENLVTEIRNVNKIVPLEIEFSETILIDKSWGDFDVFKKFKRIKFFANCSYSIDLSSLSENDINVNNSINEINIILPKPEVFSIDINENKTVYQEPFLGFLRFGDIKLKPEEFSVIQNRLSKTFQDKMKEPMLYDQALNNSKIALTDVVTKITDSKFSINISFK